MLRYISECPFKYKNVARSAVVFEDFNDVKVAICLTMPPIWQHKNHLIDKKPFEFLVGNDKVVATHMHLEKGGRMSLCRRGVIFPYKRG